MSPSTCEPPSPRPPPSGTASGARQAAARRSPPTSTTEGAVVARGYYRENLSFCWRRTGTTSSCFHPKQRGVAVVGDVSGRPEGTVAGVAQSGDDEPLLVEAVVDGDGEQVDRGELLGDAGDAFGGADGGQHQQPVGVALFEHALEDGTHRRPRRQHRVGDDDGVGRGDVRQLLVVDVDGEPAPLVHAGGLVPAGGDDALASLREGLEQPLDERRRRPEDVDDDNVVHPGDPLAHRLGHRRLHVDVLGVEDAVDYLVAADAAELHQPLAEGDLFGFDAPEVRERVPRECVSH